MLTELKEVIFEAYDAGRITCGRARELTGIRGILDFRDEYNAWRQEQQNRVTHSSRAKTARLIDLNNAARALADATDTGEQFLEPDGTHLKNLIRAALYWDTPAVHEAIAEFKAEHR